MVKVELYKSNNPNKQVYDQSHPVFNSIFWITEDFVPHQTRITEIDIPQFTYYSSISNKNKSNRTGTLSTSNKVRLFDDTDSSPITASIYNAIYQEITSKFNSKLGQIILFSNRIKCQANKVFHRRANEAKFITWRCIRRSATSKYQYLRNIRDQQFLWCWIRAPNHSDLFNVEKKKKKKVSKYY